MSTSFNLIYEKFLEMISDSTLALLSDDNLKDILFLYLDKAKALEFKQCKSDLNTIISPSSFIQSFNGNGITTGFTITTAPIVGSTLIAKVNGIDNTNYLYEDAPLKRFNFLTAPTTGTGNVILGWTFYGAFEANLTSEEQWILACAMLLGWLEPKIKEERLLRTAIGNKDFKESSHANQLKNLLDLEDVTRQKLKTYIISYTYNDCEGFN